MSAVLIVAIVVLLVLAAVMIVATGRRRSSTGILSRETRKRDASAADAPSAEVAEETDDQDARERADETRQALGSGAAAPATRGSTAVAERVEVDEEAVGIGRRQFFNRGILLMMALVGGAFGASLIAFLWPSAAGGFGGKVQVDASKSDIEKLFSEKKEPYYIPEARTYLQPYPKADVKDAAKIYNPAIVKGMEQGFIGLYQKCVHLGCKVPWCQSSQWFECPCHGSKYNRVGEKRGGPAPRGLDAFALTISGESITIDTGIPYIGAPIGTDTTGQGAEGPPCVGG
ncbi:MAG: QcrA and Rieske domain-containing protein [Acidimicrobiia bacterium]